MIAVPQNAAPQPRGLLGAWISQQIQGLYPGYFAMVMATGIVSNALFLQGYKGPSAALFAVNAVAYPLLWLLTILRVVRFPGKVWADIISPRLVFTFFTIVAATDVFGAGMQLRGFVAPAQAMWIFALIAWLLMIYLSFGVLTFLNTAHGANVVHGGWLIAIVGTESLVVLGTAVAPAFGSLSPTVFVLVHMFWGVGLGLYGIFITLFAYRIFFFEVKPEDITPLLWVVMGAAAITCNAGTMLILNDPKMPFLLAMRPFIDGVTLMMWAWATWWIPLLVLKGVWKHIICRAPMTYTPMFWSLVFPLGMYALASLRMSLAADFPPLRAISSGMVWIALGAWILTAGGLVTSTIRSYAQFGKAARAPA